MNVHFSDFFDLESEVVSSFGAFNVSLLTDLPLFIDPFLLFNSQKPAYQELHQSILRYMRFLRDVSQTPDLSTGLQDAWFRFPEVKQTWLGYSVRGNRGHGLGREFARALHRGFATVFRDFGEESVSRDSHLEKLCLIRNGVGRDMISDFTTNLVKGYLAEYTQAFAQAHLGSAQRKRVHLPRILFDYQTRSWSGQVYELPFVAGDYVLLIPDDMLTKDETWISRPDLLDRLSAIANALPNSVLRAQLNEYLLRAVPRGPKTTKKQIREAIAGAIDRFPEVLDYYVRDREDHGSEAVPVSRQRVAEVREKFVEHVHQLVSALEAKTSFYEISENTYEDARQRLLFLKDVVENKGLHRVFYFKGEPIKREEDLQMVYRLTWYGAVSDVTREANDGRGPADFKVSRGALDKTIVELKLARNRSLKRNLEKQTPVYERAADATHVSLKGILYFTTEELAKVRRVLKELGLETDESIVLIDARADNKPSGSRA